MSPKWEIPGLLSEQNSQTLLKCLPILMRFFVYARNHPIPFIQMGFEYIYAISSENETSMN